MKTEIISYADDSWSASYGTFFTDLLCYVQCECGFKGEPHLRKYGIPLEVRFESLEHQVKHLQEGR